MPVWTWTILRRLLVDRGVTIEEQRVILNRFEQTKGPCVNISNKDLEKVVGNAELSRELREAFQDRV